MSDTKVNSAPQFRTGIDYFTGGLPEITSVDSTLTTTTPFSLFPPLLSFNSDFPFFDPFLMNFANFGTNDSLFSIPFFPMQISPLPYLNSGNAAFYSSADNGSNSSSAIFDFYKNKSAHTPKHQPQLLSVTGAKGNNGGKSRLSGVREPVPPAVSPGKKSTKKNRTQKTNLGRNIVAEEVKPGVYLNKFNYVNLSGMKPYMIDALVKMSQKAKELGYTLIVSDGYRSHAQQADVRRRKPKLAAPPGKSAHEYGVAVDLGLYKDGKQVSIYDVPEFSNYAVSIGMEWGGTWKSKKEPWHFNFSGWKDFADISGEYRRWNHLA